MAFVGHQALERGVNLSWKLFENTTFDDTTNYSVLIQVDKKKFGQVISNLVSNAIKFTPAGGSVSVTAAIRPDSLESDPHAGGASVPKKELVVEVRDTGAGISQVVYVLRTLSKPFVFLCRKEV